MKGTNGTADTSPADRYAAATRAAAAMRGDLGEFRASLAFDLDAFQVDACVALSRGEGILVAAPTGSGKTVVGEFAIYCALKQGMKAFYTTPIKALSNQKYHDLVERYGPESVGLLTGDTSINAQAQVVVMTTEVLRNMLYAGSDALAGLGFVVMDEVHYLADRFRGPVWEEVILHLPPAVQLVALSATVSNAEEFGQWLAEVRGDVAVVVSEHRPVPLTQHVMLSGAPGDDVPRDAWRGRGAHLVNLYADAATAADAADRSRIERGEAAQLDAELAALSRSHQRDQSPGWGGRGRRGAARDRHRNGKAGQWGQSPAGMQSRRPPSRTATVLTLAEAGLLPAIYFIFSRAGCDGAVDQLARSHVALTTEAERAQIAQLIEERTQDIPEQDKAVLGFWRWRDCLLAGYSAHHAGMLPVFKETVESLFGMGLIKVVFATETLALGINMPARSVVLEKLDKWDGSAHTPLTAGEYTQLTGRAGRRGIDVAGHAVVVDHQGFDPTALAGLASRRLYPLNSSFTPSYNMAVNLVHQAGYERARDILEMSFAQFQADRGVVELAREAQQQSRALEGYAAAMTCHLGDFSQYAALRGELTQVERDYARSRRQPAGDAASGPAGAEPRHRSKRAADRDRARSGHPDDQRDARVRLGAQVEELRRRLSAHPCHTCPEREDHARWANRYRKLAADHARLMRRIDGRTGTIAKQFDKICEVLTALGYLSGRKPDLSVTPDGMWLRRLYAENDLLVAECLRRGTWDRLTPAGLAAAVSTVLYEAKRERAPIDGFPGGPDGALAAALGETIRLWSELDDLGQSYGLSTTNEVEFGIVGPIHRWASGRGLESALRNTDLAAGDFVRWSKQVLDVLDQIATAAPDAQTASAAQRAMTAMRRGVVAYSSI